MTSNASKTSNNVMTSARKSRGKVIGRRRGIDANVAKSERGVPRMIIERFKYSLPRILRTDLPGAKFEEACVV
jgi:hypothetical protein